VRGSAGQVRARQGMIVLFDHQIQGAARHGRARRGKARQGMIVAYHQIHGKAGPGMAWQGRAGQGRGFTLNTWRRYG